MCTLTLFRKSSGYRVFMNRDERHDRIAELPPQILCKEHGIFGPLDPLSGGTWVAYNAQGFWGCLLNGYFGRNDPESTARRSRGDILSDLLSCLDPLQAARDMDPSPYQDFRLVIGSAHAHILFVWDGKNYSEEPFHAVIDDRAFLLSSSSWKQDEVIEIRKELFQSWMNTHPTIAKGIPDFHYGQLPHAESAPLMLRSYSGTKSITAMDIGGDTVTMDYWTLADIHAHIEPDAGRRHA